MAEDDKTKVEPAVPAPAPSEPPAPASTPDPLSTPAPDISAQLNADPEPVPEVEYPTYGNETADAIVGTLKAAKVPPSKAKEVLAEAVQSMDASKVDRKALEALIGKDGAEITILRLEKVFKERSTMINDVVESIYKTMGSKAVSDTVITWAKEKAQRDEAFNAEYQEYVSMFNSSRTKAVLAAEALKKLYEADPNNSSLGIKMINGDKAASVITEDTTISRSQYLDAVKRAYAENNMKEVERLDRIRLKSMQSSN